MGMPLDDFAPGCQRGFVDRVGELAEAAASRGHQAPALQHATGDEAAPPARPADLLPEAEDLARRHDHAVERGSRAPQVLHLAELVRMFLGPSVKP